MKAALITHIQEDKELMREIQGEIDDLNAKKIEKLIKKYEYTKSSLPTHFE